MNFAELTNQLAKKSVTGDWDAICALSAEQLSSFCFAQYVQNGPNTPANRLLAIMDDDDKSLWLLDMTLGPPELSFPLTTVDPNTQGIGCVLSMEVLRGKLIRFSFAAGTTQILSVAELQHAQNLITGTVELTTQGLTPPPTDLTVDSQGHVRLNLAKGSYNPTVQGIDPNSTLATKLKTVIDTYFQHNDVPYLLGTLVNNVHSQSQPGADQTTNPQTARCLQPRHVDFYSQSSESGGKGCLLLFIQTLTGTTTQPAPFALKPYPIPDDQTASLIISNEVIFNQLLNDNGVLNEQFNAFGTSFQCRQNDGLYSLVGSGGKINIGNITGYSGNTSPDSGGNPDIFSVSNTDDTSPVTNPNTEVVIPMDNFTLGAGGAALAASWQQEYTQEWGLQQITLGRGAHLFYKLESVKGTVTLNQDITPSIDTGNNVTFTVPSANVTYAGEKFSGWDKFWGNFDLSNTLESNIASKMSSVVSTYKLSSVNTFSLTNLLFPAGSMVKLKQVALPGDLLATGLINLPLPVTPAGLTDLSEGCKLQFSVQGSAGESYSWGLGAGSPGSIDNQGLYQAPASIKQVAIVAIMAIDPADSKKQGYAAVRLLPPQPHGATTSPASVLLNAGQTVELSARVIATKSTSFDWTMQPAGVGSLQTGLLDAWSYTAPIEFTKDTPTTVVLTATSKDNPQLTGTTVVTLQAIAAVTITAPATSVPARGRLELTAKSSSTDALTFHWLVYPIGRGSVVVSKDDSSKATYEAPAEIANTSVAIAAYCSEGAGGLGIINLEIKADSKT